MEEQTEVHKLSKISINAVEWELTAAPQVLHIDTEDDDFIELILVKNPEEECHWIEER